MKYLKQLKQLLCKHVWIEDYITYKMIFPYTFGRLKVRRCVKCGKVEKR